MKYLSFDVGIKNLAYCSLNEDKKILDWGIINLNKDPKCQCGIKKECSNVRFLTKRRERKCETRFE